MALSQGQRTQDLILPDGGPSAQEMNTIKGPAFGWRHVFALMGFLGFLNVYAMRVNLSVAIVAMVNSTDDSSGGKNSSDFNGTCPAPIKPANSTDDNRIHGTTFDWDSGTQGLVLGCFFYGYVLTQIPGGRGAERFGGKWILGLGILLTSIFTILMPLAAKVDFRLLVATRIIEGLGEGVTFPVMHAMLAEWAPPLERSKLSTLIYTGSMMGTVISLPLTGYICDTLGWEAAFYIFGALGIVWFFFWVLLVYDTPAKHPFISNEERDLIELSLGRRPKLIMSRSSSIVSELDGSRIGDDVPIISVRSRPKSLPIPYKAIFTSVPFYAILIAHCCQNWGFYTLLTELPTYMSKILHFDIKENALLSALPYFIMWILAITGSYIADFVRSRGYLSTTATRKTFNSVAFFIPATCLVMIHYAGCNRVAVIALLCATVGINGFQFSSVNCNHIDIAPNFAGTLMGITNMFANTMGFLAPQIIGFLTEGHEDIQHWQTVFYIAASVYVVGNLLYVIMASGEEQPWNQVDDDDNESSVPIRPSNQEDLIEDFY